MGTFVKKSELINRCIQLFRETGVSQDDARIASEVIVHANVRGIESHGVIRMEHYLNKIKAGGINPKPEITIAKTSASTAIINGDDGLGHVVSVKAMNHAIALSEDTGVGVVLAQNSSHCGALSYFVRHAAQAGKIGLAMTNTDKLVAPFGGIEPFFGTNPLAFGIPALKNPPLILDMSTSTAAYGKVMRAKMLNEHIPPDWATDKNGLPVTDPHKFHALTSFGGAKGYGLSMIVDILAGILTSSAFGPHVAPMYGDLAKKRKLGHFFLALDISKFIRTETFLEKIDQLIDELHKSPSSSNVSKVMVPGEVENLREMEREEAGIPLSDVEYRFIFKVSEHKL